jgi:polysaccharide export outer membrane protein
MKSFLLIVFCLCGAVHGQLSPAANNELPGGNLPIQRIGINDLVAISVYDAPELTRTLRVDATGYVRLPMLKSRIQAAGLMPTELESAIAKALQAAQLIIEPFVTVTVAEYHSRPINVMGAVKRPLTFQAIGKVTLLDALAKAEGLGPEAGHEVLLSKTDANGQALIRRIPIKALLEAADPELNIQLTGGEEIRVPEAGKIFVVGNVKKPGSFVAREDAGITVLKALAVSEGLMAYAAKEAYIYRREGTAGKREIPVQLSKIMERKSPDIPLEADDILYIPDSTRKRMGFAALEKVLLFGSGASSALIYAGVR